MIHLESGTVFKVLQVFNSPEESESAAELERKGAAGFPAAIAIFVADLSLQSHVK